jgi:hypothetical protein
MKRMKRTLLLAALTCLALGSTQLQAQDNNNNNTNGDNGGRRRGGRGGGNFDPSQIQERIVENSRDALEVKDDAEWKAIEPLIKKVVEAGMEARRDNFGAMRLAFRNRDNGGGDNGGGGPRRFGQNQSPEMEALDKALEAKASKTELAAAVAKVQEARKEKQAALDKAQADLRKVLSTRQEAIATANGLL